MTSTWFEQIHLSCNDHASSALTVTWFMPGGEDCKLLYRGQGETSWRVEQGFWMRVDALRTIRRATMRQLQPDSCYEYQLAISEAQALTDRRSAIYRAHTGPAGALEGTLGFCWGMPTGATQDALLAANPRLLLGGGWFAPPPDKFETMAYAQGVDGWFNAMQPMLRRVPLFSQFGWDECYPPASWRQWESRLAQPIGPEGKRYGALDLGDLHMVGMPTPRQEKDVRALDWLDRDLARAQLRGARRSLIFGCAPLGEADGPYRHRLSEIVQRHGVEMILCWGARGLESASLGDCPVVVCGAGPYALLRVKPETEIEVELG